MGGFMLSLFCRCRTRSRLPAFAALAATSFAAFASAAQAQGLPAKWLPWIEFGGAYSSERSRGEATLFVPLMQSQSTMLFADFRGKIFEESNSEGNFSLGLRHMMPNGWNLGVWGGFDLRRTTNGNTFGQVAGGIEALSANWDLRANFYLPTERDKLIGTSTATIGSGTPTTTVALVGSNLLMTTSTLVTTTTTTTRELALWGVDGEVGFRVPVDDWLGLRESNAIQSELRLYAGAFYFDHPDLGTPMVGPKARAELRLNNIVASLPGSRLSFEAGWRHDEVRGSAWEVGARLRVPFGGDERRYAALSAQERRMTDRIERDVDIVSTKSTTSSTTTTGSVGTSEQVEDALTGVRFDRVATVDGTGDLQAATNTAGANSLVIASGTFNMGSTSITLPGDLTLMGAGATIAVKGVTSGTVANFTAAGSTPTYSYIGSGPSVPGIVLASNSHVTGLNMVGDAAGLSTGFMLAGSNVTNVVLSNLDMHNFYGGFLANTLAYSSAASNVEARFIGVTAHNDLKTNSNFSVAVEGSNNTFSFLNSSFTNIRPGLFFEGDNNHVSLDGVTIANTNIFMGAVTTYNATSGGSSTLNITNSHFSGIMGPAFQIFEGAHNVTFSNSTVHGINFVSGFGVLVGADNAIVSMNNVTFTGHFNNRVISVFGANTVLSGSGNVSTATFGTSFCDLSGSATGTFNFTTPAVTCP
jgi:hypothetical protein